MKVKLEQEDIEVIALKVADVLKPLLSGNSKHETDDAIFDVRALAEYLKVSNKWIYERTHLKEIPYIKAGGLLRFRKKDIDKWLNTYNIPAVGTPERILRAVK